MPEPDMRGRPAPLPTRVTSARTARATPHHEPTLGATDVLLLSSLATLASLAVLCHFVSLLAPITLLGGAIVIVAHACRSPRTRIVHDFFPVIAIIVIYELLGPIIPVVNPARWDGTFAALDARLFGQFPSAWFGALGRPAWLTDLASLTYVLYYLLPVVLGVRLYAGDRDEFHAFAFAIVAAFLVSYAGYLLFPTLGPRPPGDSVLGGGAITRGVLGFVRTVEGNPLDAFPSGHVAIALVCVGRGWRLFPRWRAPLALVLAGIGFSTVYLSYHYVIDVIAGVGLGAALLLVLQRRGRHHGHRGFAGRRHREFRMPRCAGIPAA